jgi:crossover junction endodeoxyribonuclease RusA
MRLVLPYPPTANLYWRVFRGRAVKSPDARRYQALVRALSIQQRGTAPIHAGPVNVVAKLYRPRRIGDLDNGLKVALDALKGVAFNDDSQVVRIEAERHDDKANPRLEIEVTEAA